MLRYRESLSRHFKDAGVLEVLYCKLKSPKIIVLSEEIGDLYLILIS